MSKVTPLLQSPVFIIKHRARLCALSISFKQWSWKEMPLALPSGVAWVASGDISVSASHNNATKCLSFETDLGWEHSLMPFVHCTPLYPGCVRGLGTGQGKYMLQKQLWLLVGPVCPGTILQYPCPPCSYQSGMSSLAKMFHMQSCHNWRTGHNCQCE